MNDFTPHPLLPPQSLHGRMLIITLAIMAFLSMLSIAAVDMIAQNAMKWRSNIAQEMTLQIKPIEGKAIEQDLIKARDILRNTQGIKSISIYSKDESAKLLEPFLGAGANLAELPIPRLIAITLDETNRPNIAALNETLKKALPNSSLDTHQPARAHLAKMAMTLVAVGLIIVLMMLITSSLTVVFATRAAVATNHTVVEVLHFVGAEDSFIAKQFERFFFSLGIKGAVIGVSLALLSILALSYGLGFTRASALGDQLEALFGSFSIGLNSLLGGLGLMIILTFLTSLTTRRTVLRALDKIE